MPRQARVTEWSEQYRRAIIRFENGETTGINWRNIKYPSMFKECHNTLFLNERVGFSTKGQKRWIRITALEAFCKSYKSLQRAIRCKHGTKQIRDTNVLQQINLLKVAYEAIHPGRIELTRHTHNTSRAHVACSILAAYQAIIEEAKASLGTTIVPARMLVRVIGAPCAEVRPQWANY